MSIPLTEENMAALQYNLQQAQRAAERLARKLSDRRGAGPCDDDETGFWPCPLCDEANDGADCRDDKDGCCWLAWGYAADLPTGGAA